ncbi:MAG: TRAP transporter small permease [Anaerovoracaceae bacterium]|jgi:C4-dicarboxylate transporter DctQ subunit
MQVLNKIIDRCISALAGIAAFVVLLLLLAVFFATMTRYLFNQPFAFLIDYAAYSLLYIAFLGTPWLYQKRGHVSVDMVLEALPPRVKHIWVGALDLVVFVIAVVLCVVSFKLTKTNFLGQIALPDFLSTPKWLLLAPISLSMFFLAIQAIRNAIESFKNKPGIEGGIE